MEFQREQELKIGEKDYYVVDVLKIDGNTYLYTQEIRDDELVENAYVVFKYDSEKNGMSIIKNEEKLNDLLNKFAENIMKDLGDSSNE